ncbi:MAG: hypothetical protein M1826_001994 [Phylliscum demangeonii]|nr:MAG: hypothetical protein M1826_001994 [Phylliscum demangeonii]
MKDEGSEEMRPLSPRETASRYVRWFQEEYGPTKLPFHEDGYAQALDLAKKELRFLIVILMSPEHDNTSSFVRSTLLSQEVVDYLTSPRHHILLWGGSVQEADASQIAAALHCTKFPFTAIIAHTPQISSTSMSVVAQIVGPTPAAAFLARIKDAVAQYSEALEATRASRASHEAERQLRDQQNSAYEISLARDRARVKENRKAEAAALRVQQEAAQKIQAEQRRIQQQERWKRWRMQSLSPEPALDSAGATRVSIRMLSGERILRRFAPDVDMEELYAFVECYGENRPSNELVDQPKGYEHQFTFRLISPFPLKVYEPQLGVTIRECVGKNVNLIVEAVDDGHEDEN